MYNSRILDNELAFFKVLSCDDLWKEMKKYMFPGKKTSNFYNYKSGIIAIKYGYISLIKDSNNIVLPPNAIDIAAEVGNLELIKYFHENKIGGCTRYAMHFAAEKGYLDIVKWLHYTRKVTCCDNTIDVAAMNGHLEIIKFLHQNVKKSCIGYGMADAITNNDLEVVKFLYKNVLIANMDKYHLITYAKDNDHLEIVDFLRNN